MLKFMKLFLLAILITGCNSEPEPKPTTPLMIKTSNGDIRFMVEVANTPEDLKTGLMYRTNLGFNSGMIFNIYPVRPMTMWMKNTKIPLDMLFVAPDASIIMIKENAEPMSEAHIVCKEPVRAVIEINAGQVKRHNIKVGDKVTHMLLNSMLDIKTPGPEAQMQNQPAPVSKPEISIPEIKQPIVSQTEPTIPEIKQPVAPKISIQSKPVNTQQPTQNVPSIATQPVQAPKLPIVAPKI